MRFWLILLGLGCLAVAGCASFGEYLTRGVEAGPPVVDDVVRVAANPADYTAWIEIAKALGYIVLGGTAEAGRRKLVTRKAP